MYVDVAAVGVSILDSGKHAIQWVSRVQYGTSNLLRTN